MLCTLHYPYIHGKTEDSDPYIETHFLVHDRFDPLTGISLSCLDNYEEYNTDNENETDNDDDEDELDNNRIIKINDSIEFLKNMVNSEESNGYAHPTIRNYHNIISMPNYIKPEIGKYVILPTLETIAILKTFWIRIIQKKWKKIFKERQHIINLMSYPLSLHIRELTGKWKTNISNLPGLKGMLSELKYT